MANHRKRPWRIYGVLGGAHTQTISTFATSVAARKRAKDLARFRDYEEVHVVRSFDGPPEGVPYRWVYFRGGKHETQVYLGGQWVNRVGSEEAPKPTPEQAAAKIRVIRPPLVREQQLAKDVLTIAEPVFPDSFWNTDERIGRACEALGWTTQEARLWARGQRGGPS